MRSRQLVDLQDASSPSSPHYAAFHAIFRTLFSLPTFAFFRELVLSPPYSYQLLEFRLSCGGASSVPYIRIFWSRFLSIRTINKVRKLLTFFFRIRLRGLGASCRSNTQISSSNIPPLIIEVYQNHHRHHL